MSIVSIPFTPAPTYYVYALLCEDVKGLGYIKFGYTKNIGTRLTALRGNSPIPAKYFAIIDVSSKRRALDLESELHKIFKDRRSQGEWFRFDFDSEADKKEFGVGCRTAFAMTGIVNGGWTKLSVKALDQHVKERRAAFLKSKKKYTIINKHKMRKQQKDAWKELDTYGR